MPNKLIHRDQECDCAGIAPGFPMHEEHCAVYTGVPQWEIEARAEAIANADPVWSAPAAEWVPEGAEPF